MNSCREGGGFREQAERPESVRVFRHLLCPLGPCTIQGRGVRLAREQRRLVAIFAADVVGYSHAAYEQIYYSSLMPRTYLCARLLETLD